jgi:hypothetical protein
MIIKTINYIYKLYIYIFNAIFIHMQRCENKLIINYSIEMCKIKIILFL